MIKKLLVTGLASLLSVISFAQITTTSATYTSGAQDIERAFGGVDTSDESTCVDTLLVAIPAGNYIYSVDVAYDLEAFGQVWTSDFESYVECATTNNKEGNSFGGSTNANGVESFSRTGLLFTTGIAANGNLKFVLHAFRTFGAAGCDTTNSKVVDSTFTVTVHHGPAPTCYPPTNPAVNWTMSNKAELTWITGGATNWQVEYGTSGFTLGAGTLINATTNPFVISGFSANTNYDFYVRDSCGAGDVSIWSPVGTFSTICAPSSSPFTENFDGTSWTPGTGGNNTGDAIAACWERNAGPPVGFGGDYFWGTRSGATGTGNTGPTGDHTSGADNYMYTEASVGGYQDVATLTSPLVDLGSLTTPEIEFYYHMFGQYIGQLNVDIWSQSTGWQTVLTKNGQQQDSSTQAWIKEAVTLSNFVNDTVRVRFRAIRSFQATGDMAIDDVKFKEAPSCPKPTNLTVNALSPTSVTLNWTSAGASSWDIAYGSVGNTPGNMTVVNVTVKPAVIAGLTPGASYDFYVREHCSATDTSDWLGPLKATLFCNPTTAPYYENFDGSAWVPGNGVYNLGDTIAPCWIRYPDPGSFATDPYYWGARDNAPTTPGTGPNADYSGTGNFMYTESSAGTAGQNAALSAPYMSLVGLTTPELRFWYHMFGNGMGTLSVDVYSASSGLNLGVFTLTGQKHANPNAAWTEAVVSLSSYVNDTILIVFRGIRGANNQSDIAIDEVTVDNAPSCPDPTNFTSSNVTSNSVDLAWTTGGATNWNIAFGATGFTPGGTFASAGTNPFTLTGLTPGTTYDLYVRDSCAVGDVSNWVGPISIFTLCAPVAAPYTENFDDTTWTVNGNGAPGVINPCWMRSSTTTYWWKPRTGTTPSNQTGPSGDHTSGTGKYIYTETSNGGNTASITSPLIDLSALTTPELSFYYHMFGVEINKLDVEVNDNGTWTNVSTITGAQQANSAAPWLEKVVDLSAYTGDTIQIRFTGTRNGGFQNRVDISIDDFLVREAPSCPAPTNFTSSNVTSTSVDLAWTTGGASNWNVAFGPTGFTPGATFASATTNPYTLTGLTPGTSYDLYVRDSCAAGDVSTWVGPISIFTACAPVAAPYTENFDGPTWTVNGNGAPGVIDPCWTRTSTTTYWWKPRTGTTPSNQTGPSGDHTTGSGKYIYTETSNGGTTTSISSPFVDVSALTSPELTFYYHMFGALINKLDVEVNSGGTWAVVSTIIGQQHANSAAPWLEKIVDLSAYAGDTIQIRFTGTRNNGFNNRVDISIDDVDVHEAPNCPKPSLVSVGTLTSTSAQILWTTGGASLWQIEYGAVGFTPGSGTIVNANTNPFVVTGLTPNTDYDFYVRDSCGLGDVSAWEGPANGRTLCGTYTAPFAENFDGASWIVGAGGFAAGTVDPCWIRSSAVQYWWRPGTGATPTPQTGPSGDHTSGSGKYIYSESQTGSTHTEILSPQIDLDTLSNPELRFWYHMYGSMITNLHLEINDGTGWANLDSLLGQQQTSQTDAWQEMVIDLSSYVGDVIQIRFNANKVAGNQNRADICIDDLTIENAPSCPNPTLLSSTASTTTSVTLSWTTGGAGNWNIEYGPVGFANGAGTIVSATTNPFTVTGLSPAQSYDFYVRDSCGVGEVSTWEGPITASTACGTVLAPYFENFDIGFDEGTGVLNDGSTINACWTRNPDSAFHWGGGAGGTGTGGTGPNGDHTSGFGNYVYTEASLTPNGSVALLETPSINLTPLNSPEMHFWYHMFAQNGTVGSLRWEIFSNNTWTVLDSLTGSQGNAWQEIVVNLSSYANQTVKIRFRGRKSNGPVPQQSDISIDDLSIVEAPTCPDPSGLAANALTLNSIQLSWTTGGATAWEIEYGPTGFTPGAGTTVSATTNPFTVTGLTQATCYDFYVRDVCGTNDYSNWIGPVNACTFNCVNGCAYTLRLTDDWGDGWTGNNQGSIYHSVNLTIDQTTTSYTLDNGTDTTFTINVCDGDTIILDFLISGQWAFECGVILRDANNNVLFSDTNMTAGNIYSGSANCNNPCPAPLASYNYAKSGLQVNFDASASTGTTLLYAWDFGDGTNGSGQMPSHTYAQDGAYQVELIVTDLCNQTDTITQTVTVCGPLSANFTWTQNGLDLNVDASALANAVTWAWTFGDGGTANTSTATHSYASTGTYSVKLTVTNLCGQTADTSFVIVICVKPIANWTYKILSSGSNGMTVQFDGTSSFAGTNFIWDFGDGNTNTTSNYPVHTYAVPGLFYVVRLIVENSCGDSDTLTASLASIGEDENELSQFNVYPNPANDFLNIEVPNNKVNDTFNLRLINAAGLIVIDQKLEGNSLELNTEKLPNGYYILEIEGNTSVVRKRIVINH